MAALRAFFVGAVLFFLFLAVSESLPLVWDEGDTAARTDSILCWANEILPSKTPPDSSPWSEAVLRKYIPNTISLEGHPAGYTLLTSAGKQICSEFHLDTNSIVSEKQTYRFGPILLWGIALGTVFYRLEKTFSLSAAFFGTISIILIPRVFTHAQIAFGDSVLMSSWLLAWGFFPLIFRNICGAFLWGTILGLAASAKFTGALVPIPFIVWTLLLPKSERQQILFRIFAAAIPALLLTFYLLNPPIWHSPFTGIYEYFRLNTHRNAYNIAILFLGKIYNLDHPLPWWNPFFWTMVTIPTGLLFSGLTVIFLFLRSLITRRGTTHSLGFFRAEGLLILNWLTLIVVRCFPGIPVHDGIRLFVAAFPFFGILAGLGLAHIWNKNKIFCKVAAAAALAGSASSLILYFPQELSYYNLVIGGLPGASRAGMEVTYYWDGLDQEIVRFLKKPDTENNKQNPVLFSAASYGTLSRWRRQEGIIPQIETVTRLKDPQKAAELLTAAPFSFYILQNRGSALTKQDRRLLQSGKPIAVKSAGNWIIGTHPLFPSWNPWNLQSVPIILIYSYADFLQACALPEQKEDQKK